MKVSDFGVPTYPVDGHAVLVRFGEMAWQTQVCIDGVWLTASKATLISEDSNTNRLVLEIPVGHYGDFKVEYLGKPATIVRGSEPGQVAELPA